MSKRQRVEWVECFRGLQLLHQNPGKYRIPDLHPLADYQIEIAQVISNKWIR
jgi:hypothetical protein